MRYWQQLSQGRGEGREQQHVLHELKAEKQQGHHCMVESLGSSNFCQRLNFQEEGELLPQSKAEVCSVLFISLSGTHTHNLLPSWAVWACAFSSHSSLAKTLLCFSISYLQQPVFFVMHRLNAKQLGRHIQASPCLCRSLPASRIWPWSGMEEAQSLTNWHPVTVFDAKTFQSSSGVCSNTGIYNYSLEKKNSSSAGALQKGK